MSKRLPDITHLQFLILDALAGADQAGRDLRERMTAHGVSSSAPAFYQMMGRLEDARLVEGRYDQKVLAGQTVKERRYQITRTGNRALAATRSFYRDRLAAARVVRKLSHA
jgi:DNA-binding PadR family transcriptional regulator